METTVNTFNGGLDKDTAKDKFQNTKYFNLENGRILTDEGLSSLSIGNVRGNIELSPLAGLTTQELVGWCTLRDDYILFYRDIATPAIGYIYRMTQVNDGTFQLITDGIHNYLYYNVNFNFGDIIIAIGRYENDLVQKVYWTDVTVVDPTSSTYMTYEHNNMFRMLNLTSPTLSITSIDKINIVQDVNFSTSPIVFTGFTEGSLNVGMVQYAYRYYNLYGSETRFSPCTELIPITVSKEIIGTRLYKGTAANTMSGKGVTCSISNIDQTFDRIEIVSILYSSYNGTPNIQIVSQQPTTSTTIVFTDSGTNYFGTISVDEYTLVKNPIYAKAMVVKDNRLFIGNIKEDIYWNTGLINWDSRSYRFTSNTNVSIGSKICKIYNGSGSIDAVLTGPTPTYPNMTTQATLDCINGYNYVANDFTPTFNDYKYQADGVTLGGSGPNIWYSFNYSRAYDLDYQLDSALSDQLSFYTQISSVKDQLSIYRGFQHDEVYRFGIVFYDKYSRPSYTKWIGDIRMPSYADHNFDSTSSGTLQANPVFIDFTISNVPTDAVAYQIVYVQRGVNDRTVDAVGIAHGVEDSYGGAGDFASIAKLNNTNPQTTNGHPGIRNGDLSWLSQYDLVDFSCPEVLYSTPHSDSTYLDLVASIPVGNIRYRTRGSTSEQVVHYGVSAPLSTKVRQPIQDIRIFHQGQTGVVITGSGSKPWTQVCDNDSTYTESGSRGTSMIIGLQNPFASLAGNTSYGIFMLRRNIIGYGGNTYNDRFQNTYIAASQITPIGTTTVTCLYGDVYISMFEFLRGIYDPNAGTPMQDWHIVPVETSINLLFNYGYHASKALFVSDPLPSLQVFTAFEFTDYHWLNEDRLYTYNNVYSMESIGNQFLVASLDQSQISVTPTEVRYSNFKYDGELVDSWLVYGTNNTNSCIGNYGELTYLEEQTNYIYCFQEHGIALVASNRQELTTATSGTPVILGRGGVLDRFDYYSTEVGCQWGFEVTSSQNNLYWIDGSHKKMYRITDKGIETLSDLKLCSTMFSNAVDKYSRTWGQYDPALKSLYVTLYNKYPNNLAVPTYLGTTVNGTNKYYLSFNTGTLTNRATYKYTKLTIGNIYNLSVINNTPVTNGRFKVLEVDGATSYYIVVEDMDTIITTPITTQLFDMSYYIEYRNNFTFTFNEFIDNFESIHTFLPDWYLQNSKSFLTYYPTTGSLYQHNIGTYGQYYNLPLNSLRIDLISNAQGQGIKEWNNINWFSECTKESQDLPNVTITKIQSENDYQQTEVVLLYPPLDDDYVMYNEAINMPVTPYNGTTTYGINSVVNIGGVLYISLQTGNTGNTPTSSPAYWSVYKLANIRRVKRQFNTAIPRDEDNNELLPQYVPSTYRAGDAVVYFDRRYTCKVNVRSYSGGVKYLPGDVVILTGQIYKKLNGNNTTPPSVDWVNITSAFIPPTGTSDDTPYWTYDPIYNRLRDYYIRTILQYPNYNDQRFILHDVRTSYEVL